MRRSIGGVLTTVLFLSLHAPTLHAQPCDALLPIGVLPPAGGFVPGCAHVYALKLGAAPGPDGNYVLIAYPACANGPCAGTTGLAALQCTASSGYACCVTPAQAIPTLTGTNVGTLQTGLNQRFVADTDARTPLCRADYSGNGARLVNVPLVHFPGADRTQVIVDGVAPAFLTSPSSGTGTATVVTIEVVPDGATPATPSSWGHLKLRYR